MTTTDPKSPAQDEPSETYAWFVVIVLLLAYTCSFIDRMILTLLVGPIRADLGISDTEMSLLVGFAFAVLYTVAGIPLGYIADRGNRRRLIAIGITGWSAMTAACGLAPNYLSLFFARVGVGIGEATLSPAAYSLLSDYFRKDTLGRAVAVYSIGVPLGSGIALMLGGLIVEMATKMPPVDLPGIEDAAPWRLVFFMAALPGIAVALLMLLVREPVRKGACAVGRSFGGVFTFLWQHRAAFGAHFLGLSLLTLVIYGFMAWVPTFFARSHGMEPAAAGFWFGIILAVGGAVGLLAGGALADRLFNRGRKDGHLITILVATIGAAPFLVLAPLMPSSTLAFLCLAPAMLIASMHGGVAGAALQLITPNRFRAQVTALYFFVANLIGFGLGPTAIAAITDYGFGRDDALATSMIVVAAVALPLSALTITWGRAAFRRSVAAMEADETA